MTLTKQKIVDSLHDQCGFSKNRSMDLVDSVFEIIRSRLESGEEVLISRFGKFCVRKKNERKGRNPATGDDLMLGARRVVTFKCSPALRDKVNMKASSDRKSNDTRQR